MNVIFMCTANSCRSQMAESWARRLFPADWSVASCGLVTYPIVERTREAMAEVGLDLEGQKPQTLDEYDLDSFDLVVTLSREAGRFLPALSDPDRHWARPIVDPMGASGSEEEIRAAFRTGRDEVRAIVEEVIAAGER